MLGCVAGGPWASRLHRCEVDVALYAGDLDTVDGPEWPVRVLRFVIVIVGHLSEVCSGRNVHWLLVQA